MRILFALAFGMALPSFGALGYYFITGDPTVRPLGISEAALARFANSKADLAIVVTIRRGQNAVTNMSADEIENRFAAALRPYDVPTRIRTDIVSGRDVTVVLQVRNTYLGPFSLNESAAAIAAAVSAYHLNFDAEMSDGNGITFLK